MPGSFDDPPPFPGSFDGFLGSFDGSRGPPFLPKMGKHHGSGSHSSFPAMNRSKSGKFPVGAGSKTGKFPGAGSGSRPPRPSGSRAGIFPHGAGSKAGRLPAAGSKKSKKSASRAPSFVD